MTDGLDIEDVKGMSDDHLLDRAARHQAELRKGRRMEAEGRAIINANINEYVMCQNELYSRVCNRVEEATDTIEAAESEEQVRPFFIPLPRR
jgi:hypothetical protein